MFKAPSQEMLDHLLKKAINDCSGNNNCVSTLIKFMEKKEFWAAYIIDSVKGTFGLRGSSRSESNHSSVKNFVSQYLEGIHGAMQQLMRRQHKLMLQNNELIFKQYLEMKVIEQSHSIETNIHDTFLFEASKVLCVKGYKFIKKNYMKASVIFPKVLVDQSIIFFDMYNTQSKVIFKDKNDLCSCYVSKANMMQCKHDICVNQKFDISKIGKCWLKRKNISLSLYKGNYNSPTIIKYQSMISDFSVVETFHDSEIKNVDELMNVNDNFISNELKINKMLPEQQMTYSSYSTICDNLYNDIKNKNEISNYVIGLLLESSHVINSTTDKTIVLSRLLEQTKEFQNMFSNMSEKSNIMLNEPVKIPHKTSNKRKKSILEHKKNDKNVNNTLKKKKKLVVFVLLLGILLLVVQQR